MIKLFVRRKQNWDNCTYEELDRFLGRINEIKIWDRLYTVSYFSYRLAIQRIAFDSWKIPWFFEPVESFVADLRDEDLVLPVDDDDWFHPDLGSILECENGDFVFWDEIVNQTAYKADLHSWFGCHTTMCSNNYALRGRLLKKLPQAQRDYVLMGHANVLKVMASARVAVKKIPLHLSCYNWHPGSVSVLRRSSTEGKMASLLPVRLHQRVRPEFQWIEPWRRKFLEVVASVRFRKWFL